MTVTKAVILSAGWGTRFMPATISMAKEMFPIIDKPMLFYHLKECADSGITDVIIISNKSKTELRDFVFPPKAVIERLKKAGKINLLDEYYSVRNKLNIKIINQNKMTGSAGAVALAEKFVGGQPFVLFFGDDTFTTTIPVAKMLIDEYEKTGKSVCVLNKVKKSEISRYGCAKLKKENGVNKLVGIIEKPKAEEAPSLYAVVGRYLLTPDIFKLLPSIKPKNGEYFLPDAINMQAQEGNCVGIAHGGIYHDCGNKLEFAKAFTTFMINSPEFGKEYQQFLKNLIK